MGGGSLYHDLVIHVRCHWFACSGYDPVVGACVNNKQCTGEGGALKSAGLGGAWPFHFSIEGHLDLFVSVEVLNALYQADWKALVCENSVEHSLANGVECPVNVVCCYCWPYCRVHKVPLSAKPFLGFSEVQHEGVSGLVDLKAAEVFWSYSACCCAHPV